MKSRLFLSVMLATFLVLSSAQNVFATIEIAYDTGPPPLGGRAQKAGEYLAVRFSLPSGLSSAHLMKARFYKAANDTAAAETNVKVHVLGSNGVTELTTPFTFDIATLNAWNDASLNVIVTGDFYIAIEYLTTHDPGIGVSGPTQGRSYHGTPGGWSPELYALMIHAVIEPPAPVGGVVIPTNKLELLTPYLALAALIAVVSTIVVVKRRRD